MTFHACGIGEILGAFFLCCSVGGTHARGSFSFSHKSGHHEGGGEAGVDCADTIYELQYARLTTYSSESIAGMMDEKNTSQKA
jgi:hypothetical protein